MSSSMYLILLYLAIILAFVLAYHLVRKYLTVRQKLAGNPTYPLVKAFSILLMAFIIQNSMSRAIFPMLMEEMGLSVQVYPGNPAETIVFYLVVGAVAITYALVLRGQGVSK